MNISSSLHDPFVLKKTYLGPELPNGLDRTAVKYSDTVEGSKSEYLAPSYVPISIFEDGPQKLSGAVENWIERRSVDESLWPDIRSDLENHVEQRIQLFFYQMLLVYKTTLIFAFYGKAEFQVGGKDMKGLKGRYVAAHSSTLPTLRLAQSDFSDRSISFAKGSSFYYSWNTTIYLPEAANHVDINVDGVKMEEAGVCLREKATEILNQVAAGKKTPSEGLFDFLGFFLKTTEGLCLQEKNAEKLFVLSLYHNAAASYYDKLGKEASFEERLCFSKGPVSEYFYMSVQSQMHQNLLGQMFDRSPPLAKIAVLPPGFSWAAIAAQVQAKVDKGGVHSTSTMMKYGNICIACPSVLASAKEFLIGLHPFSLEERQEILGRICREAPDFVKAVKEVIWESCKTSNIRNLEGILLFLLRDVALSLVAERLIEEEVKQRQDESQSESKHETGCLIRKNGDDGKKAKAPDSPLKPPSSVVLEEEVKAGDSGGPASRPSAASDLSPLKDLFQPMAAKFSKTDTVKKSLAACAKVEAVRKAAWLHLQYLSKLSKSSQEEDISRILKIKTAKTIGNLGLSKTMLGVYSAVLREIRQEKLKEPRNTMPGVLVHLFVDVLEKGPEIQ